MAGKVAEQDMHTTGGFVCRQHHITIEHRQRRNHVTDIFGRLKRDARAAMIEDGVNETLAISAIEFMHAW